MPSNEVDALYRSLLEVVVDYVGKDNVQSVVVHADPLVGAADVSICLEDDSYDRFALAVERMGQVQSTFLEELSIEYVLLAGEPSALRSAVPAKELVYS